MGWRQRPAIAAVVSAHSRRQTAYRTFRRRRQRFPRYRLFASGLADNKPQLISLYQHLQRDPTGVADAVRALFVEANRTPAAYLALREHFNSKDTDPLSRAALFIYINRFGFNGLYRTNREGECAIPPTENRKRIPNFQEDALLGFAKTPAASRVVYTRQQMFDQPGKLGAGFILPGHGRQAHHIRPDFQQRPGHVLSDPAPLSDQVDDGHLVPFIEVGSDAGNAVVRHVKGALMHDNRCYIRH